MSYEIIFQTHVFYEPAPTAQDEDRFLVALERGSNNCFTHDNRVARDWSIFAMGSHDDVMETASNFASMIPGGCLRRVRGKISVSSFIKGIRNELREAKQIGANQSCGYWVNRVSLPEDDTVVAQMSVLGLTCERITRFGEQRVRVSIPADRKALVFEIARLYPNAHPSYLTEVLGLKKS